MRLVVPGTVIYASNVFPGMVICLPDGNRFDVGEVRQAEGNYEFFTFVNGGGNIAVDVACGDYVTVLGYFNEG